MAIKGFDSLQSLGEWYDSEVFQDITTDLLYVFHRQENQWYCYRWTSGQREIAYLDRAGGDLPIVTQVYPTY